MDAVSTNAEKALVSSVEEVVLLVQQHGLLIIEDVESGGRRVSFWIPREVVLDDARFTAVLTAALKKDPMEAHWGKVPLVPSCCSKSSR